jgi:cellulose synthase/poly-beta-1,6-N-acetylglucosamine synthase-like glycosyltransferase
VDVLTSVLIFLVALGTVPLFSGVYQFTLAGLHRFRRKSPDAAYFPRVAIVIPAWNEADVIERTVHWLMRLTYPKQRVRVYVVDDGSDDGTPEILDRLVERYRGRVFNLRREDGGQGKAHTINFGLRRISQEDWYEAVMIIDADVLFTAGSLRRMTRHLADPGVGAVTAYIKEGSRPDNFLNRFVAFEYVTAQAAARRAQNVLGAQACLAGGAQLIRRQSLEAVGGEIDTSTLAEDTYTTFMIQIAGQRVVFEPHAIVWAEEPRSVGALWKQRVRWGRGNVQITTRFRRLWFNRRGGRLGGLGFALIWFSVFMLPVFLVASSVGLIGLYLIDKEISIEVFRSFWILTAGTYLFVTFSSFAIDPATARRAWREGILFPGLISLTIILWALLPPLADEVVAGVVIDLGYDPNGTIQDVALLFSYFWLTGSLALAAGLRWLEDRPVIRHLVPPLVYLIGYGPLLSAMTLAAYWRQVRGVEMRWEKTEKTGMVGEVSA